MKSTNKEIFFITILTFFSNQVLSMEKDFPVAMVEEDELSNDIMQAIAESQKSHANVEKDSLDHLITLIAESKNTDNTKELIPTFQEMIQKDATIVNMYRNGLKLIHYACAANNKELVALLINANKDLVNSPTITADNRMDLYPIHITAMYNYVNLFEFLVTKGAHFGVEDARGYNVAHTAANNGHFNMIHFLLTNTNIDPLAKTHERLSTYDFPSTLYDLAKSYLKSHPEFYPYEEPKYKQILCYLVNLTDNSGETILYKAIREENPNRVAHLIADGARANGIINNQGLTPLDMALIRAGRGFPNSKQDTGLEIASILIRQGNADVNYVHTDHSNVTYLFGAVAGNNLPMVKLLLENGAIPIIHTTIGSPLDKAKQNESLYQLKQDNTNISISREIIKLLLDYNLYYRVKSKTSSHNSKVASLITGCLTLGANPNVKHAGFTPLTMATMYNDIELIKQLLQHGAQVDLPLGDGSTALYIAAEQGFVEAAKILLEAGANHLQKNIKNETPLTIAFEKGISFKEDIAFHNNNRCLEIYNIFSTIENSKKNKIENN